MEKIENRVKRVVGSYAIKRALYKDFAFSVKRIVEEIIQKEDIGKYVQNVTAREKDPKSLSKKLLNKELEGEPENTTYFEKNEIIYFSDIKDLAGVRIILYFNGDILKTLRLALQKEFSYSTKDEQKHDDYKGQESIHSTIEFNEERLTLSEYAKFRGLRCEIQLVTALQHAWSELEHDVVYKPQGGWKRTEVSKFSDLFQEAKEYIKKASDIFESIMYIHLNEDRFLLFDKFDDLNNTKLCEYLDRLAVYMQKNYIQNDVVLKDILRKIRKIVLVGEKNKEVRGINTFGETEVKTFEEILTKVLAILNDQRVTYPNEENFKSVFRLAVDWSSFLKKNENIEKIHNFLKKLAGYDYQALQQIGLLNQRFILDIVLGWSSEEKVKNIAIVKIVVKEFLQPSYAGLVTDQRNKLPLTEGSLEGGAGGVLAKIRKESIELLLTLYVLAASEKEKFEIIKVLGESSRTARSGTDRSLEKIILENTNYLMDKYREIVFNEQEKVVCILPVAMEIERQLAWFKKRWIEKTRRIDDFIFKLKKDEKYLFYSQIVDKDSLDADGKRGEKIDFVAGVVANEKWLEILDGVANAARIEEDWKFSDFHEFLTKLTERETKNAEYFLNNALKNNTALLDFSDAFISGFRNSGKLDLWDRYVMEIENREDGSLLSKALHSFYLNLRNQKKPSFREEDFFWIKNIASRKEKYAFLSNNSYNKYYFDYTLFRLLAIVWKYKKKEAEELLVDEIKKVSGDFLERKLDEMELFISWEDLEISEWNKKNIAYLMECIISSRKMDYHSQGLIGEIGKISFEYVLKIIKSRLSLSDRLTKNMDYDAIPMQLEDGFIALIKKNKNRFESEMLSWIMKKKLKSFNFYECGLLLQQLGEIYADIIRALIKKDTADAFNKALGMTRSAHGSDLILAFEIADAIINSEALMNMEKDGFLARVSASIYATEIISGEYEISEAHKRKAKEIMKIKEMLEKNNASTLLVEFADKMISVLGDQAEKERQ